MTSPCILVVDDEPDIRELVREILADEGYEVEVAENGAAARRQREACRPDLILLDIWMPDIDGISLLKEWHAEEGPCCPVIMMSGHGTVETAVEATRLGAYDYLEKPLSLARLLLTVEHALKEAQLRRENVDLREQTQPVIEPVGRSRTLQELKEQARRIAGHDTWVLIRGEPGSGKETFARYLHAHGPRAGGPFVAVGVGTLAGEHSAVELFGAEEGGRVHRGLLEQANGGVLFLDEVADMDPQTQARLSSALESRRFMRMGGSGEVAVDVQVIAATHRDLEEEVRVGRFREDLYYHLNVVPLAIPPLRDHREDVPELLGFYIDRLAQRDRLPYRRFSVAAQNRLRNHAWPGNIRELKNLIQRLMIFSGEEEVSIEEVESALAGGGTVSAAAAGDIDAFLHLPLREARDQFEKAYLERQLEVVGGNMTQLAKASGMERTNLYRKLKALGIDPKAFGR